MRLLNCRALVKWISSVVRQCECFNHFYAFTDGSPTEALRFKVVHLTIRLYICCSISVLSGGISVILATGIHCMRGVHCKGFQG